MVLLCHIPGGPVFSDYFVVELEVKIKMVQHSVETIHRNKLYAGNFLGYIVTIFKANISLYFLHRLIAKVCAVINLTRLPSTAVLLWYVVCL